jgi:hypothetical protein
MTLTWVGVRGLEPGTSSLSVQDGPRSEAATSLWSAVEMSPMSWLCEAVAVIVAVSCPWLPFRTH